ncbi:hypothetical protein SO802_028819 [Lithocarpus litseifolius]|uniref:Uncharacterized protein n=1 Tax=Lithocarpus litseifolius TaxID=425828 RepID=A0AAW2BRB8_9ROSI
MGGISSRTPIALPPKFKISDVKKFDRLGDPKQHVRRYLSIAEMKGLDEKQNLHAFPLLLVEGASKWYYSLDPSKTKDRGCYQQWTIERGESKPSIKKTYGEGAIAFMAPNLVNISAIIPQQTLPYPNFTKKAHQELFDLGITFSQAYKNLISKGFIKPLDPTPMPNLVPPTWNLNEHCHYHLKSAIKPTIAFP